MNASHAVGVFHVGCDESCTCTGDGAVSCGPRCHAPLHRAGASPDAKDPLCVEQFVDGDECCVVITCAGTSEDESVDLDDGAGAAGNSSESRGPCRGIKVRLDRNACLVSL